MPAFARATARHVLSAERRAEGFAIFNPLYESLRDCSSQGRRSGHDIGAQLAVIGQSISHYRIESKLGDGGMGVVYRAVDTHLDRPVAIKVLRPDAVADPEQRRRFVQEARAASALNHPNIVTIYDINQSDGVDFIAMEYVPGLALDRVIERGPLGLTEALRYAIQIADALGKAHSAGIIHRDLKPGNIMVTPEGSVKLVDFGVAKLIETVRNEAETVTLNSSPLTEKGTVLGTIAYMSPEQAQGKPVDARSDIFSFGAVLYEMLTGRRAFSGDTKLATLTAILHDEPKSIGELTKSAPPEIDRIVHRCLRKDLNRRFHHMVDVKVALEELSDEANSDKTEPLRGARVSAARRLAFVAAIGLLATIVAFWIGSRERVAPHPYVLTRLTSDSGLTTEPALSPDGKLVAYASDRSGDGNLDIWVQQVPSGEAIRLTNDPADDREPDFSPDGQRIVFRSDRTGGGIYVVSVLGGTDRLLAPRGQRPRFSPDGNRIVYWVGARGGYTASEIHLVDASGGASRPLDVGVAFARSPVWSPDGKHLLFVGARDASLARDGDWDWWVYHMDGGQPIRTGVRLLLQKMGITGSPQPGSWLAGERVVFSAAFGDSTNLWELSLSASASRIEGTPRRLTTGPGPELFPSASGTGRMVFANHVENLDVWWLPVEANQGKVLGGLQRVTGEAASESSATISSDGGRLSFVSNRSGNRDIWMKDLGSGKETAVTLTPFEELNAVFSRDWTRIAYNRSENQQWPIYVASVREPGVPEKVCDDCRALNDSSSDGNRLLYTRTVDARTPIAIELLNIISREKIRLIEHPTHTLFSPRFSPDDGWVSFHEFTGLASRRIYVTRLRGNAPASADNWVAITDGAGLDRDACWAPDGNLLYFYSERDGFPCIWAQGLEPQTKRPLGDAFPVYHMHHARRSIRTFDDLSLARLSTAPGKLVFSMGEYTGNIWMATNQR